MIISSSTSSKTADKIYQKTLEILGLEDLFEVEIERVSEDEIKQLNLTHRSKDEPTDVLSFPYTEFSLPFTEQAYSADKNPENGRIMLGSIVYCEECRGDMSVSQLIAHGLLHLFGFDHETDEEHEKMMELECSITQAL